MNWKIGDWVVFDLSIGQVKEIRAYGETFSDGIFETSGRLADRFRPLTLRNKRIIDWFDWHYNELRKLNGNTGFNYPDINRYFCHLALQAIDEEDIEAGKKFFNKGSDFVKAAGNYQKTIDGVNLFRSVP
jgi:hypothetical protein